MSAHRLRRRSTRVEMAGLDGQVIAATYAAFEFAAMSAMRTAGVPTQELRLLHELKAVLAASLDPLADADPSSSNNGNGLERCHLCLRPAVGGWCSPSVAPDCRAEARRRLGINEFQVRRLRAAEWSARIAHRKASAGQPAEFAHPDAAIERQQERSVSV